MVRKEKFRKKIVKIVPIKELGEPVVVSVPISQVTSEVGIYVLHLLTLSSYTFYY